MCKPSFYIPSLNSFIFGPFSDKLEQNVVNHIIDNFNKKNNYNMIMIGPIQLLDNVLVIDQIREKINELNKKNEILSCVSSSISSTDSLT